MRATVAGARVAVEHVCTRERRDERVERSGDELGGRCELTNAALGEDADLVGERCGVFEVVGDEEDREIEVREDLLELCANLDLRARVECRERLVEQQRPRVAGQCSRERDALPFPARELPRVRVGQALDAEPSQVLVCRPLPGVLDVLANREVGEQGVVLVDEPDSTSLGGKGVFGRRLEPDFVAAADPTRRGSEEAGDGVQDCRLARAGRADERDRRSDPKGQLDVEGPERNPNVFELEVARHVSPILSPRSRTMLMRTSTPDIASVASKFWSNSA